MQLLSKHFSQLRAFMLRSRFALLIDFFHCLFFLIEHFVGRLNCLLLNPFFSLSNLVDLLRRLAKLCPELLINTLELAVVFLPCLERLNQLLQLHDLRLELFQGGIVLQKGDIVVGFL